MNLNFISKALVLPLLVTLSACGSKNTIDLQKPAVAPQPETPASQKPGSPDNPNDPNSHPEKPLPAPPPESGILPANYRLVCESLNTPFSTISTNAHGFDANYLLFLGSYPGQDASVVARDHYNIRVANAAAPIAGSPVDQLDMLFTGRLHSSSDQNGDLRLFFANVDLLLRTSNAKNIGAAPAISRSVANAAIAQHLIPANYGSSDEGNFVLIPGSGGFKVMSHDLSKTYGSIAADPSLTILPRLFEKQKVYAALVSSGSGFSVVVKKLSITSTSVSVSQSLSTGSSKGTASSIQLFDDSSLVWSESSSATGSSSITIAKLGLSSGGVSRATYKSSVANAKIFPQIAAVHSAPDQIANIYVAVEAVKQGQDENGKAIASISYAKVERLSLNDSGNAIVRVGSADYPADSTAQVAARGLSGATIVQTLFTTAHSDQILGTFDAFYGAQIYQLRGGLFDNIGSSNCLNPAVVEETQQQ